MSKALTLPLFTEGSGAVISPCGRFRYMLRRRWGPGTSCCWVMLNPSTADAETDDPTIRRCIGFAKRWQLDAIEVVNLFALRATDPRDVLVASREYRAQQLLPEQMRTAVDPTGQPESLEHIDRGIRRSSVVVAAWGCSIKDTHAIDDFVVQAARAHGKAVMCLGRTAGGAPRHPLYVSYNVLKESYA